MSLSEPALGRQRLCVPRGHVEPVVAPALLNAALSTPDVVERFRPLLPVGYRATAEAFRRAASEVTVEELTTHYTEGLERFHDVLAPRVKRVLSELAGGAWDLSKHRVFAAGSDVDMIMHVVDEAAARAPVHVFPGDWWGFKKGANRDRVHFSDADAAFSCLCLPSVRNGNVTSDMVSFVERSSSSLWNLNLWPTLTDADRHAAASDLAPSLDKALLSVSFSRGFGMTASQLGVLLVPEKHPLLAHQETLEWLTYFHNAIAARAFCNVDVDALRMIDNARRTEVHAWLAQHGLPVTETGTYYVKSFRPSKEGGAALDERLKPLVRDDLVRLCFKPQQT